MKRSVTGYTNLPVFDPSVTFVIVSTKISFVPKNNFPI